MARIAAFCVLLPSLAAAAPHRAASPPSSDSIAHTAAGPVRGIVGEDFRMWLGIPYAQPPVGQLRWRPPRLPLPWNITRDAVDMPQECAQVRVPPG